MIDRGEGGSRLHAGSPMWDSILGLQDHAFGPKAGTKPLSHPGVPIIIIIFKCFIYLREGEQEQGQRQKEFGRSRLPTEQEA